MIDCIWVEQPFQTQDYFGISVLGLVNLFHQHFGKGKNNYMKGHGLNTAITATIPRLIVNTEERRREVRVSTPRNLPS